MRLYNVNDLLLSIEYDITAIKSIVNYFDNNYIVFGNKRTGLWYYYKNKVYFKSTDGHYNGWEFSWKRLNLNLVESLIVHGNALIIDNTKKGKVFPDSFTKTIPIWATIINRCIGYDSTLLQHLSSSEQDEIERICTRFINDMKSHACYPLLEEMLDRYKSKCNLPIRICYIEHPLDTMKVISQLNPNYSTLFLLSASDDYHGRRIINGNGFLYVKGSGDDIDDVFPKYLTPALLHHIIANNDTLNYPHYKSTIQIDYKFYTISDTLTIGHIKILDSILKDQLFHTILNLSQQELGYKNEVHIPLEPGKRGLYPFERALTPIQSLFNSGNTMVIIDNDYERSCCLAIFSLVLTIPTPSKSDILACYHTIQSLTDLDVRRCYLNKLSQYFNK